MTENPNDEQPDLTQERSKSLATKWTSVADRVDIVVHVCQKLP